MANMLEAALQYLHAGYSVIPIRKGDKKPALPSWLEYGDRLPTEAEVTEWFYHKNVNIGIVTGKVSNLVVVDVDDPKQYGPLMNKYPTGQVVQTPSGGFHLYYTYDGTDIKNSVKAVLPGVDVRGYHGYVVAPPSEGYHRFGTPMRNIQQLPPALKTTIQDATRYDVQIAQPGPVNDDRDAATLYHRVVKSGFSPGAHNQELKDVARFLFRIGHSEERVIELVSTLNDLDPTPLPQTEMLKTIKSGLDYERNRLAAKEVVQQVTVPAEVKQVEQRQAAVEKFDVMGWGDVASMYEGRADKWLIDGWLPEAALMVTAAPPESYKTWLGLEAGVNVAFGDKALPFLGAFNGPKDPAPVLIVQQEDYMGLLTERVETIISAKTRLAEYPYMEVDLTDGKPGDKFISFGSVFDAPFLIHTKAGLSFEDDNSIYALEQRIQEYGIKYVMIDPLYMLGRADDYFASLALKMGMIKQLRDKYGTTFMFIHHNRKGTKNNKATAAGERENMFGSQLLNGAFEGLWILDEVEDKKRILTRKGKVFHGKQDQYVLDFTIDTGRPLEVHYKDPDEGDVRIDYLDKRLYEVHTSLIVPADYTDAEQEVLDTVIEYGEVKRPDIQTEHNLTSAQAGRLLDQLVAKGALQVTDETKNNKQGRAYILRKAF